MSNFAYPVIDPVKTGINIKTLRQQSGLTVKELQNVMGFTSPQAIYKWQWGECLPDIQNLLFMSKLFGVNVENILAVEG